MRSAAIPPVEGALSACPAPLAHQHTRLGDGGIPRQTASARFRPLIMKILSASDASVSEGGKRTNLRSVRSASLSASSPGKRASGRSSEDRGKITLRA
ncbi:hypothetical protein AAFF_G00058460 [Aldrovandia affinis]|uniref:Uncharacterized protein n=1 Tax=Aldrovandia affinis TaxID=143900 RepID=A0AAD7WE31_9TELE|nr:hypothetical protein AAFF_G00058460 [Aldrovandia affinis]